MSTIINKKHRFISGIFALGLLLCIPNILLAQSAKKIEQKADASFKNKNYYNAAILYSSILKDSSLVKKSELLIYPFQPGSTNHQTHLKESNKTRVMYKLAESYRLYNHNKEALTQYEQYLSTRDTKFPLAQLWYGFCLIADNQPEKAKSALMSFLKQNKTKDEYAEKARMGISSCDMIRLTKSEKPLATVSRFKNTISEDGSNFAFEKKNDTVFWFTSSRHEYDRNEKKIFPVKLYSGNLLNNKIVKISPASSADLNMAASSITSDGRMAYFTGWKEDPKSGALSFAIYYMKFDAGDSRGSVPMMLAAPINLVGFNSKQPFISADGKWLLFSSNRPGGYGKYDLWMVSMDGTKPVGEALNLGANINTAANEITPFYHANSSTLYFSSDGRVGMGGMDIYETKGELSQNQWTEPIRNLGLPYNSVKDDQYYRIDGNTDTAYLSSDRASACCLEIFKAVKIKDTDTARADTVRQRVDLVQNKISESKSIPTITEEEKKNLHLIDSINAITFIRRNVNYGFASAKIRKEDHPQLDEIVEVLEKNSELNILIASFTDCIGSQAANINLSRKRSESVRWYLISKGVASSRINIDFFGKEHFIMACKEDSSYKTKQQITNRRSDLIITKEKKPKWIPSGRELDISKIQQQLSDNTFYCQSTAYKNDNREVRTEKHSAYINKGIEKKSYGNINNYYVNGLPRQPKEIIRTKQTALSYNKGMRKDTLVLQHKLPIVELLDLTPRLKEADVIDEMVKRVPRKPFLLYTTSDSVRIDLYDNGVFDYDTVSVIYNKHISVYKQLLQVSKPITFYVKLNKEQSRNEMIFFAENLGLTPPNSALMIITDGENKRTEVSISSDLENNVVIYFIKVNKDK